MENVDFFPSWEKIEILKGVISVFPGEFHIQGSGRESKHTFNTHALTHYTAVSDLLAGRHCHSWQLPRTKVPPPTTQRQGQERGTCVRSPNENTLQRPYVHATFYWRKRDLHLLVLPPLAPSLAAHGMIYTSLRTSPQWGVATAY